MFFLSRFTWNISHQCGQTTAFTPNVTLHRRKDSISILNQSKKCKTTQFQLENFTSIRLLRLCIWFCRKNGVWSFNMSHCEHHTLIFIISKEIFPLKIRHNYLLIKKNRFENPEKRSFGWTRVTFYPELFVYWFWLRFCPISNKK